jgi:hypothetical protein
MKSTSAGRCTASAAEQRGLQKVKDALHARLVRPRNTEKASAVLDEGEDSRKPRQSRIPARHRRADTGAMELRPSPAQKKSGDRAPAPEARRPLPGVRERQRIRPERAEGGGADCRAGAVGGRCLLARAVRCGGCGQVFTTQEPEGVGPDKCDETAAAMIAQLKYGSGIPFLAAGATGRSPQDSVAGGNPVGDCEGGRGVAQTGAR